MATESVSITSRRSFNLMLFICVVLVVVTIGLATQVHSRNRDIDQMEEIVGDTQEAVTHLEEFVVELETEDNDELARNEAITRAVNLVPEIRAILCEEFPEATACLGG